MRSMRSILAFFFMSITHDVMALSEGTMDDALELQCSVCRDISSSFEKGLKETSKKTYPGGNYAWEHGNLKPYHLSEARLLDVLEKICPSTPKPSKCNQILSDHDDDITQWWMSKNETKPTLEDFICVQTMSVCCPYGTYGPSCTACNTTYTAENLPCNGHGKCKGNGTRSGTGLCECDYNFVGDSCASCDKKLYYNETQKSCEKCHKSCNGSCTDDSASTCDECASGWEKAENGTCVDVDECVTGNATCGENTFCHNKKGSYKCKDCDQSCVGCSGPSSSNCTECAIGYSLVNGSCVDVDECATTDVSCPSGHFCMNTLGNYSCEKCHTGCLTECNSTGLEGCTNCAAGYEKTSPESHGCKDIDECATKTFSCQPAQYCSNVEGSFECKECNKKCVECSGPSLFDCTDCAKGYKIDPTSNRSCIDVDECADGLATCKEGTYCVNKEGEYKCKDCHKSCELCRGYGADSCISCSDRYEMRDGKCKKRKDYDESDDDKDSKKTKKSKKNKDGESKKESKDEL